MLFSKKRLPEQPQNIVGADTIRKILKSGIAYSDDHPLFPPVGSVRDFFRADSLPSLQPNATESWAQVIDKDPAPLPDERNREGYCGSDHFAYWLSGYGDYQKTLAVANDYNIRGGRYFDFGASSGRVARHFAAQSDRWDVWMSDFKANSVEFVLRHLPMSIKAFLNTNTPSLPLADAYFDIVTAFSVFTHINEGETAWLLELRRLLKPGGIACLTIHDEQTWKNMVPDLRGYVARFRPDIADLENMPDGKTVVTFREDDPYSCHVFHAKDHLDRVWGRYFEICEVRSLYHYQQAMVICRAKG